MLSLSELFYQLYDLVETVRCLDRRIAKITFSVLVIVHCQIRIFEFMAGKDTRDAAVFIDHTVGKEMF
jgi:hypothetical protein